MKALGRRKKGKLKRLEELAETDPAWQFEAKPEPVQEPVFTNVAIEKIKAEIENPHAETTAISVRDGKMALGIENLFRFRDLKGTALMSDTYLFNAWDDKEGKINSVCLSSKKDRQLIAFGAQKRFVSVYEIVGEDNAKELKHIDKASAPVPVTNVAFTKNNNLIYSWGDSLYYNEVRKDHLHYVTDRTMEKPISAIAVDAQGRTAVSLEYEIKIYTDIELGLKEDADFNIRSVHENPVWINDMAFSPDNKFLAVACNVQNWSDGCIDIFRLDYKNDKLCLVGKRASKLPKKIDFITDNTFVTCEHDKLIYWRIDERK